MRLRYHSAAAAADAGQRHRPEWRSRCSVVERARPIQDDARRGPGGGKLRSRPRRKRRERKPAGLADTIFLSTIAAVALFLAYYFLLKQTLLTSAVIAGLGLVGSVALNHYLEPAPAGKGRCSGAAHAPQALSAQPAAVTAGTPA